MVSFFFCSFEELVLLTSAGTVSQQSFVMEMRRNVIWFLQSAIKYMERSFSYVCKPRISFESCTFHFRGQGLLLDACFEKQGVYLSNSQLSEVVMSRLFWNLEKQFPGI